MPPTRQVLVALLLASSAVVATGVGAPPPGVVCDACGTSIETAAEERGIDLDVTHSTVTLQVHANGSGTWTMTNRIDGDDALRRLRENDTLLRNIVAEDVNHGVGAMDDDRDDEHVASTAVDGTTVTVTVRDPVVARQTPGGALVVDVFHAAGRGSGWRVNVDRFTLKGPPGTVLASDAVAAIGADRASADGGTVTVHGALDGSVAFRQNDVFVAFAPAGAATGLLGTLAVALAWAPVVVEGFVTYHALGAALLLAALAGTHALRHRGPTGDRRRVVAWAAGALAVYLVVTLVAVPPGSSHSPVALVITLVFAGFALVVAAGSWFVYPK